MLIDFTEQTYTVMLWHLQGSKSDIQGALFRDALDQPLRFRFRVRTYVDTNVFDSEDKKEFFELNHVPVDESQAIERIELLLAEFLDLLGPMTRIERLDINGNFERFLEAAQTVSWLHVRAVAGAQA